LILRVISDSILAEARRCIVTAKQPAVKKYIVKLSADEREKAQCADPKGKAPARQVLKARILLKADASEAGEAWSDGQIAEALDTSLDTIARTRQQLVEGGLPAALSRKQSPNSARKRIFDGAAEAKLIALTCSAPPKGRRRWTLTLLETAVVELKIVDRASDNTIGVRSKKRAQASPPQAMGHPASGQRRLHSRHGGRPGGLSEAA
jgi:hypothetical protein